ncbi:MAG: DUF3313 family protein [Opitutaceae bacterium]|nr:DUF3313 family protein [Opitutaceae bacterium]
MALLAVVLWFTAGCQSPGTRPQGETAAYRDALRANAYRAVLVEPVVLGPPAAARLSPAEQAELGRALTAIVRQQCAARFALVTAPQPDALRLRTTVTDLHVASRALNLVTTAVAFVPLDMGAVALELEAVDSVTAERVAALAVRHRGRPLSSAGFRASFAPTGHIESGCAAGVAELLALLAPASPAAAPASFTLNPGT